jgi:regulator of sirC expression with transglutaminase-like and TPR domain
MNTSIKAMIQLLDDTDTEVVQHIEEEIRKKGVEMIPFLEKEWEDSGLNPILQQKIENLIHELQFELVKNRLKHWKEGGAMDIIEGFWIVSTYRYPDFSLASLKEELDQLYYEVWPHIRENLHPIDQIKVLNSVFFDQLKFGANTKNFHAITNSFINVVLENRKGNPISLCVIYMYIAQKLGFKVYGVNLPNLFVLTYQHDAIQFYINVFNRGLIFNKVDIDNYLAQLNLPQNDHYYQPCSSLEIIRRVFRNLILAYEKAGEDDRKLEVEVLINLLDD